MRVSTVLMLLVGLGLAIVLGMQWMLHASDATQAAGFRVPSESERSAAIGPIDDADGATRAALDPSAFRPMSAPGPDDWLTHHAEPGQTFAQFAAEPNRMDAARKKVYVQPIGEFGERAPKLERLRWSAERYFRLEFELLPPIPLEDLEVRTRTAPQSGGRQLLTTDLLALLETRLPRDAACLIGVTMEDLFPEDPLSFTRGTADVDKRVAIHSFLRYDPWFYEVQEAKNEELGIFLRAFKVLCNQTCLMLGMQHCVHFRCVVNGSYQYHELDATPLNLCPVCLRKLQARVGFDYAERYRDLGELYEQIDLGGLSPWVRARADAIDAQR